MTVVYEWDIETVDEHGDILDHHHADKLSTLPTLEHGQRLVLVRDIFRHPEGLTDRLWAYVENKKLPEFFGDILGDTCIRVPLRFHEELKKVFP